MDLEDLQRFLTLLSGVWAFLAAPLLLWYQHRRNKLVSWQLKEVQLNLAQLERKQGRIRPATLEEIREFTAKQGIPRIAPLLVVVLALVAFLLSIALESRTIDDLERSLDGLKSLLSEHQIVLLDMLLEEEKVVPVEAAYVSVPKYECSFSVRFPVGARLQIERFETTGDAMGNWVVGRTLVRSSEDLPIWEPVLPGLYRLRLEGESEASLIQIRRRGDR